MPFDIKKYETILNNNKHVLNCMDSVSPSMTPKESEQVRHSNKCLLWLYETHLKGRYSSIEIESVLGLVKNIIIPRLHSMTDPHALTYGEIAGILKGVMKTINTL